MKNVFKNNENIVFATVYFLVTMMSIILLSLSLIDTLEKVKIMENRLSSYTSQIDQLKLENTKMVAVIDKYNKDIVACNNKYDALNEKYSSLKIENKEVNKKFKSYKENNKYKGIHYAMESSKFNHKYLSKYDADLILENSKKYGIDPNLIVGIIWCESRFNPNAKSKVSTASGYGQFLKATGEWVSKDLLNMKNYDHKVDPFKPKNSIPMIYAYVDFLIKIHKGDIKKVLISYNGNELGKKYYESIDRYLKANTSDNIDHIEYKVKKNYNYIL